MITKDTIEDIKSNLLFILDSIVKSRQYLNKHFQNSMNNYFLENYATLPSLKRCYDTQSGRQVRKEIFSKYTAIHEAQKPQQEILKCFLIMSGFIQEHSINDSLETYRESLSQMVVSLPSDKYSRGSSDWISHQWRRLFALMVLHHTYFPSIQGVYELWYHIFDERLIARERQKKRKEELICKTEPAPYMKKICITPKSEETKQEDLIYSSTSLENQQDLPNIQNQSERFATPSLIQQFTPMPKQDFDDLEPILVKKRQTNDTIVIVKDNEDSIPTHTLSNVNYCVPSQIPMFSFEPEQLPKQISESSFLLYRPEELQYKETEQNNENQLNPQQQYFSWQRSYSQTTDAPEDYYSQPSQLYQQDYQSVYDVEDCLHKQNSYFQQMQIPQQYYSASMQEWHPQKTNQRSFQYSHEPYNNQQQFNTYWLTYCQQNNNYTDFNNEEQLERQKNICNSNNISFETQNTTSEIRSSNHFSYSYTDFQSDQYPDVKHEII